MCTPMYIYACLGMFGYVSACVCVSLPTLTSIRGQKVLQRLSALLNSRKGLECCSY